MNEQLTVKNFGPIKDATVDFKRVTVFIGPTGGGKSTLAKLAAVMRETGFITSAPILRQPIFKDYSIENYLTEDSKIDWRDEDGAFKMSHNYDINSNDKIKKIVDRFNTLIEDNSTRSNVLKETIRAYANAKKASEEGKPNTNSSNLAIHLIESLFEVTALTKPSYIPTERLFVPAIEYSWAGLMRDDISLPKILLKFANSFSVARQAVLELQISFLDAHYFHQNGQDFIKIPESETLFRLYETASGIQSVTPLLVLLEYLSRNTEQAQSFIVEEPELNLFPVAQFELVKTLIEKCGRLGSKNDLVLTTHSSYVLTALNLMCYAFRIAQQDEPTAKRVAKLIPRHCWIDPDQFAAYYVDRPGTRRKQQVRSIINKKTGLIEENELDTASQELSDLFDKLMKLRQPTKTVARTK